MGGRVGALENPVAILRIPRGHVGSTHFVGKRRSPCLIPGNRLTPRHPQGFEMGQVTGNGTFNRTTSSSIGRIIFKEAPTEHGGILECQRTSQSTGGAHRVGRIAYQRDSTAATPAGGVRFALGWRFQVYYGQFRGPCQVGGVICVVENYLCLSELGIVFILSWITIIQGF